MQSGTKAAWKSLALLAGVLVYVGMLLYSGVHNYSLMTRGVDPDMIVWAVLGVVALEVSAAALPIALHYWTHAPMHRIAAFVFYGVDLGLIFLNVILDFALNAGEAMPGWMAMYMFYGVPATPVLAGLGWSVLFLLDPASRELAMIENLKAATRESLAVRIAEQAKATDVSELVDQAAQEMTRALVADTLGASVAATGRQANSRRRLVDAEQDNPDDSQRALPSRAPSARRVPVLAWPTMKKRPAGSAYHAESEPAAELVDIENPTRPGRATGRES